MKYLWAPWRLEYIKGKKEKGCIFCTYPKKKDQAKALILAKNPLSFVILNKFPYTNGHLMVVPRRHTHKMEDLNSEEVLEMFLVVQECIKVLKKAFKPQGFNVGINIGRPAGSGIKDHIHTHVVPRWSGDSNFMPVIAHSRVVPASLEKTYKMLSPYFKTSLK